MALESTLHKQKASEKIILAARQAEKDFLAKTRSLESQVSMIREQESKIELEKQNLSKERLDLMMIKKKLESKQCSLCKIGESIREKNNLQLKNNGKSFQSTNNLRTNLENNSSDILQNDILTNIHNEQYSSLRNLRAGGPSIGSQGDNPNIDFLNTTTNFTDIFGIPASLNITSMLDSYEPTPVRMFSDLDTNFLSKIDRFEPTSIIDKSSLFSTKDLMHLESDNWLVGEFEQENMNIISHLGNDGENIAVNIGASTSGKSDAKLEEIYFNNGFNEMHRPERLDLQKEEENNTA